MEYFKMVALRAYNKEKEIKMKIKELLDDNQLYEIWLLLTDQI
jgi:hypothetical protein